MIKEVMIASFLTKSGKLCELGREKLKGEYKNYPIWALKWFKKSLICENEDLPITERANLLGVPNWVVIAVKNSKICNVVHDCFERKNNAKKLS